MMIFLGGLPESTTERDIRSFVGRAICPPWRRVFGSKNRIEGVEIIRITDPSTHSVEYHGIVDVDPESAAASAVRRLQGKRLNTSTVRVGQYHIRSSRRDQRGVQTLLEPLAISDRRKGDRRRPNLRVERVDTTGIPRSGESPEFLPFLSDQAGYPVNNG